MKKINGLIVFHHNMEDGEAIFTKALLVRAGINMTSVSVVKERLIKTAYNQEIYADKMADEINVSDYDFIVIPGGKYVSQVLGNTPKIDDLITSFNNANKYVAAICAAPGFLGHLGLLEGKHYTSFPSTQKDAYKGVYEDNLTAVIDGNIITSKAAGTIYEFVNLIVKTLINDDVAKQLSSEIQLLKK